MSFDATRWAWSARVENSGQRLVLNLADRANQTGECWPSQRRISADTRLSERTVRARLAELEGLKLISRERRQHGSAKTSDLIRLAMGKKNPREALAAAAIRRRFHRQDLPPATGMDCRPAAIADKPI